MVMNNSQLYILVDDEKWLSLGFDVQAWIEQVFDIVVKYLKSDNPRRVIDAEKNFFINLSLNNNEVVKRLNADFRGKDSPTNVLSFANVDDDEFISCLSKMEEVELGDIIIALETLQVEAKEKSISVQNHLAHLFIHGVLHLFGYDHQDDDEADEMENMEIKILQLLHIQNPYAED